MPLLITSPTIATAIATALATAPAPETQWLLPANLFRLVVVGSVIGLTVATLVIVLIWLKEWRQGQVW
ncbi:MAG: hypothetical protein EA413_14095 [Cyanobium sp. PLM2.Bin73]|nr:MAG: hypothetical protein EA413_14095 [Cyanobium sp. PLM2.Bin73]